MIKPHIIWHHAIYCFVSAFSCQNTYDSIYSTLYPRYIEKKWDECWDTACILCIHLDSTKCPRKLKENRRSCYTFFFLLLPNLFLPLYVFILFHSFLSFSAFISVLVIALLLLFYGKKCNFFSNYRLVMITVLVSKFMAIVFIYVCLVIVMV